MKPSTSVYQGILAQILLKKERKKEQRMMNLIRAF